MDMTHTALDSLKRDLKRVVDWKDRHSHLLDPLVPPIGVYGIAKQTSVAPYTDTMLTHR